MTKIHDQIEEMQRRLTESAINERAFVKALGDALSQVDQHLLHEVKRLGAEHEARRGAILHELQSLAARLCLFPSEPQAVAAIADERDVAPPSPQHSPGDWRRATSNIEEDVDSYWKAPGPSH